MERLQRHQKLIFAIIGGAVAALATPPTNIYPALFIGLAMLAFALDDAPSTARAFGRGVAWATAAGIVGMRFVPDVVQRFTSLGTAAAVAALVLLAAAQSLLWGIGSAATNLVQRRAKVPLEVAFATGTLIALSLPSVFAWTPAGIVCPWTSLVQLADLIGERGVSVLFAICAALLARALKAALSTELRTKRFRQTIAYPFAAALTIIAVVAAYGSWRISSLAKQSTTARTMRIALVNQAVGPLDRWDPKNHASILQNLQALTREAEARGVDLTVWPEAAYPYPLDHDVARNPRGPRSILGRDLQGPILFGLITLERPKSIGNGQLELNSRNSATIVTPDGAIQPSYDKLELLWFGETVPLGAHLPWLRRIFQKSGGLVPGTEARALMLPREGGDVRFGVLNCYEDTLTDVGRRVVREVRPNVLVNVTNDAWFLGSAEPELHARLARMRAVEHRVHLVRSVNLGVMSWVDDRGIEVLRDESPKASTIIATPTIGDGSLTVYARFGDLPLAVLLTITIAAFAWRASWNRPQGDGAEKQAVDKNETSASGETRAGS
ncbi:MAG: apolipoprotein N-acyltransferase [Polyangiaceae bacterium]|nr:apolipoprotein N-acyltransferase [Polyangiaceae bacterium]